MSKSRHTEEYKKYHREKSRELYKKLAMSIIKKYGGKCAVCGITEDKTKLHLHHKNFDGSIDRKRASGDGYKYKKMLAMEEKREDLELLCCEHHKMAHAAHKK